MPKGMMTCISWILWVFADFLIIPNIQLLLTVQKNTHYLAKKETQTNKNRSNYWDMLPKKGVNTFVTDLKHCPVYHFFHPE